MKSIELCCARATSGHPDTDEIPVTRQVLNALIAAGKNPDLDELTEAVFQQHGVRLSKVEAARQLAGRRQGHSGTSAKAHELSSAASEASDRARTGEGDHTTAHDAHEAAAKAHMDACLYHGRAMAYHEKKVENAAVEIPEPADEETTEIVND